MEKKEDIVDYSRREFLKKSALIGLGTGLDLNSIPGFSSLPVRIGIIGLDTSHSVVFTKLFNEHIPISGLEGFRVVAAYPYGSKNIASSVERIPKYKQEVMELGVTISESIEELLEKVDVILLETNDGTLHLEQARKVMSAKKPFFIDKPVAANYRDVKEIYSEANQLGVPMFSSSPLRFQKNIYEIRYNHKLGSILGCDTFSPAVLEESHTDLFWYGIHGVEMLFTVMGPGCKSVQRIFNKDADIVIGKWKDGRIGTFRGMRNGVHDYGGTAFGSEKNFNLGSFDGYEGLAIHIAQFFKTKISPVDYQETLEIYAFMEAADESKRNGGGEVLCKV